MGLDDTDDAAEAAGSGEARHSRFAGELDEVVIVHPGDQLITAADAAALERTVNGPASV